MLKEAEIFQKCIIDAMYSVPESSKIPDVNSIFKALLKDFASNIAYIV